MEPSIPSQQSHAARLSSVSASISGQNILSNFDLTLAKGELVSLIGPSGCGKTTILRLLAGLQNPAEGRVEVLGKSAASALRSGAVAFGFQEPALLPWLTAERNAKWLCRMRGEDIDQALFTELWALLDLSNDELSKKPNQLSGGERQRTSLVRTLCKAASLYLLDEPLSAVDYIRRVNITASLRRRLKTQNASCVLVTHDIPDAIHFADRVVLFDEHNDRLVDFSNLDTDIDRPFETRASQKFSEAVRVVMDQLEANNRAQ